MTFNSFFCSIKFTRWELELLGNIGEGSFRGRETLFEKKIEKKFPTILRSAMKLKTENIFGKFNQRSALKDPMGCALWG